MHITDLLAGSAPYLTHARKRYRLLTDEQRATIAIGFERHKRACRSLEIQPDPAWVAEAIDDVLKEGRAFVGVRPAVEIWKS